MREREGGTPHPPTRVSTRRWIRCQMTRFLKQSIAEAGMYVRTYIARYYDLTI